MKTQITFLLSLCVLLLAPAVHAGAEVSLWHRYTPPAGEPHRAFFLTNYKRGLFFGSCGPSTRSLQWSYSFDMKGTGTKFTTEQIEIKDDSAIGTAAFKPFAGEIVVDEKKKRVRITLKISSSGTTNDFIGNGEYKVRE